MEPNRIILFLGEISHEIWDYQYLILKLLNKSKVLVDLEQQDLVWMVHLWFNKCFINILGEDHLRQLQSCVVLC